jgi:hypothetical protein
MLPPVHAHRLVLEDLISPAFAVEIASEDAAANATASHLAVFIFMKPDIAFRRGAGLTVPARNLISQQEGDPP